MAVKLAEWSKLIETEYLQDFIAQGGAAVKLAVAPHPGAVNQTLYTIATVAAPKKFLTVWVNAAETKVQSVENLFFAVAREMKWDDAADFWLRERFARSGYTVAKETPLIALEEIATANGTTRNDLLAEIRRWITNDILQNHAFCREFRTSVGLLCQSHVAPQSVTPTDADVVRQWLRGESANLYALKRLRIFQKIGRHNARAMLESLSAFLPQVNHAGLVLLVDMIAVVSDQAASENALRYSRNAALDTYELLRQFIDETDRMRNFLLVVAAGPDLLHHPKKGLDNYSALKLRTSDEVRDENRANPLGTLVQLEVAHAD